MPKDGSGTPPPDGGRNPTVDFKGERRSNDTHASTTDPEARLQKKAEGEKSRLCYLGHALFWSSFGSAGVMIAFGSFAIVNLVLFWSTNVQRHSEPDRTTKQTIS